MKETPSVIEHPIFLKFLSIYAEKFKQQRGFGLWLKEYKDMENKNLFSPRVLKVLYAKQLRGIRWSHNFHYRQAVYYIGVLAQDAAEAYIDIELNSLYKICIITGEIAEDEDGDLYINLSKHEAEDICQCLNEEAEEELFIIKRMNQ